MQYMNIVCVSVYMFAHNLYYFCYLIEEKEIYSPFWLLYTQGVLTSEVDCFKTACSLVQLSRDR